MKRNTLMKRFAAGMLAFSLIIPAVPVGAHTSYNPYLNKTDGIQILTTRLDNLHADASDIKVVGNTIETRTNVRFFLDCTVDCTWSAEENLINPGTGEVRIPTGTPAGTYEVTATAKNLTEDTSADGPTVAHFYIKVKNSPAEAEGVELIPSEDDQVTVTQTGITVNGYINDDLDDEGFDREEDAHKIGVKVVPSYINSNHIELSTKAGDTKFETVKDEEDDEETVYLVRATEKVDKEKKLTVKVGKPEVDETPLPNVFDIEVKRVGLKTAWESGDEEITSTNNTTYNIPANKKVEFTLTDNGKKTLPLNLITGYSWDIKSASTDTEFDEATFIKRTNNRVDVYGKVSNGGIDKAAEVTYEDNKVTVKTTANANNLSIPDVSINPILQARDANGGNTTNGAKLILKFNNGLAEVKSAKYNFEQIGYEEGKDYTIRKENIGNVYYFEADGREIDLSKIIETKNKNVVSFENDRDNDFANPKDYRVSFEVAAIEDDTFGSKKVTDKYKINNAWDNVEGIVVNPVDGKYTLKKEGIGYFILRTVIKKATGTGKTVDTVEEYIRFVTPSTCDFYVADSGSFYYSKDEVIHLRKGESIQPYILRQQYEPFSDYNEFADISFEDMNGNEIANGSIASYFKDNDGNIKINAKNTGFVKVIFRDRVDVKKEGYLLLYVNRDTLKANSYEFNFSEAIKDGYMVNENKVNGIQNKIQLKLRGTSGAGDIGEYTSADFDFELVTANADQYAEIKDGYLITKKATNRDIEVVAKDKEGNAVVSTTFTIAEVKAGKIEEIGVSADNKDVQPSATGNGGTCEVGKSFNLIPTKLSPENATSSDIVLIGWASDNPEVATVTPDQDSTAVVRTLSAGTATITATYNGNDKATLQYVITVNPSNKIQSITPEQSAITLNRVGATATIKYTTSPVVENPSVQFLAEDPSIIDVDPSTGVVTAKKVGTTKVTITAKNNPEAKAVITVTVEGKDDVVPTDKAVEEAKAAIDAIGTVTADANSKAKIDAARAAYNKLTDAQKSELGTTALNTLTSAEASYTTVKAAADKAAADKAAADKAAADKAAADKAAADKAAADAAAQAAADAAAENIQNAKAKIKTVKNLKGKKIKVGVAKVDGAAGYQIKYSLKKNMKSAKTKTIAKTSVNLTKLKKGKTYYIQARAFSEYNGTKYYSKWSAKKKVTVKK